MIYNLIITLCCLRMLSQLSEERIDEIIESQKAYFQDIESRTSFSWRRTLYDSCQSKWKREWLLISKAMLYHLSFGQASFLQQKLCTILLGYGPYSVSLENFEKQYEIKALNFLITGWWDQVHSNGSHWGRRHQVVSAYEQSNLSTGADGLENAKISFDWLEELNRESKSPHFARFHFKQPLGVVFGNK